ncbi:hypothetical protein PLESTB_001737900 [Pleodorina starrii]|uniref:Uncharacterized protein n=1 Tax=Pleodorina starrii TaxID=330485 RepID=A0A9W6BZS1_9CHLO|nr:hypothetical protein PLESTM_000746000 [Pleodorina starrii]GLC61268.1 hypothetical protein PLESTB_001737900 [Pleodorina starrii]GLC74726.1 hypothetical protein PLESTF_001548700 [Pleodorina starrii]
MSSKIKPEIKTRVWTPSPTMAFVAPRGLAGVAVAVLATALGILSALLIYIYYRRRVRAGGPRSRRGKGMPTAPPVTVDAELIVEDYRRGSRPASRRQQLPWFLDLISPASGQRQPLFSDPPRGLNLSLALDRLWNNTAPAAEPPGDDLQDVVPYDDGQANAAGPRFLATTASGKSLQVVVKTAAVPSRNPPPQNQSERQSDVNSQESLRPSRSWQPAPPGTEQPYNSETPSRSLVDADAALPETRTLPNSSPQPDTASRTIWSGAAAGAAGAKSQGPRISGSNAAYYAPAAGPLEGKLSGAAAARPPRAGAAATGATLSGSDTDSDEPNEGASMGRPQRSQEMPRGVAVEAGQDSPAGSPGTPPAAGQGGVRGGAAATNHLGRVGDLDPAAAWYSRALHRQVSAAAQAAAQAAAGASKVHVA